MYKIIKIIRSSSKWTIVIVLLAIAQTFGNLLLPNLMAAIVNRGIIENNSSFILSAGLAMLGIAILATACAIVGILLASRVATQIAMQIRREVFFRIQKFSLIEFDSLSTASIITRTTTDVAMIQQVMIMMLVNIITAPITVIVGVVLAVNQNRNISLVLLTSIPLIIVLVAVSFWKGLPLFVKLQEKLDELNLVVKENLSGMRVIRAFDKVKYEEERFDKINLDLSQTAVSVNRLMAGMMPLMMLIINLSTIGIIWLGSHQVAAGAVEIGSIFAFIQYAMQILFSLLMMAMLFVMLPRGLASLRRIAEVLEINPSISSPNLSDSEVMTRSVEGKLGYLEFSNVSFSYPNAKQPAIKNLSFLAKPGTTTAIIGSTGAGKSTLSKLIFRFYDIDHGEIKLNGINIKSMDLHQLRNNISLVPQQGNIFHMSILDNLRYGYPQASIRLVRQATKITQALNFIEKLPEGFNTMVAQGGINLSGGQRQRLTIARAIIKPSLFYVFDDSFSALDFQTDELVRQGLRKALAQKTRLIIAERIAVIKDADQIIVLDQGEVVGVGHHRELIKNCAVYQAILQSQEISSGVKESGK